MTVQDVYNWLDRFAPFASQEDFDNAGLLVGDASAEVKRVLFALDVTLPVVQEAVQIGAQLIVTHHPLLFNGIRHILYDDPEGETLAALTAAKLSLISAHTNLDQAEGGTGDSLAALLELQNITPVSESLYLRCGMLPAPQTAEAFLRFVTQALGAPVRLYGDPVMNIRRIAIGAGALGDEFTIAAREGAQAFVVGEIKHHQLIAAQELHLAVYEAGHYATEQPGLTALYRRFAKDAQTAQWPVEARLTAIQPYVCTIA